MDRMSFASLPLAPALLGNLDSLGYRQMTPIQAQALPLILARRDLIAQAATGSGKTAAFGIGILQKLNPTLNAVQALVLCPTRELADQVAKELRRLARATGNIKILTLCGGVGLGPQINSLSHGAHVVVGTPGRIIDHLGRNSLNLARLQMLVLDEADRMTDMGFYDDIAHIVAASPARRQTLLFSATYPDDIRAASAPFLHDPAEVMVAADFEAERIEQRFHEVPSGPGPRNTAVVRLLNALQPVSSLVFCNTRIHCCDLAGALRQCGFSAIALHGELEQRERDEALIQFANRSCSVLVATDVAARGLDIQALDAVINAEVSRNVETHVHRIGRSGRGHGKAGLALNLCTANEKRRLAQIESYMGVPLRWHPLPDAIADKAAYQAPMLTLSIQGGRKNKLRPGDILGALTGDAGLAKEQIGKIDVFDFTTYVALTRDVAARACESLRAGNIKGKSFRMRILAPESALAAHADNADNADNADTADTAAE